MNLIDRVFAEPELRDRPPVLVDVGAAGGVHPAWRRIARYSVAVAFEGDVRESAALTGEQRAFRRWIFCRGLAAPTTPAGGTLPLYLTRSPQCSSTLRPRADQLGEWAFADFFAVEDCRQISALPLTDALQQAGISGIDWLKCDTQGLDLKLYQSLPEIWRQRLLVAEFEPGLIDAYEGEDKVSDVLQAMSREPFWLSDFRVGRTLRGKPAELAARFGPRLLPWCRRLGPDAPGWANLQFLREVTRVPEALDRRALLLCWVFATMNQQHGYALSVAARGRELCGPSLFSDLADDSVHRLRRFMGLNFAGWCWRRLFKQQ
jgi:hypothetical protein